MIKDGAPLNLARFVWARKSWSLRQFHIEFYRTYRDLIYKWYADLKENGKSDRSRYDPEYKHNGDLLTYDSLIALSIEDQFNAIFPALNEENWKEQLDKKTWEQSEMPYKLMIENTSGYSQDCHYCNTYQCKVHCPLPFSSKMTVLDMLHKVGVEDNISFYSNKGGKNDLILNLVWQRDFDKSFQKHLSSVGDLADKRTEKYSGGDDKGGSNQKNNVSIDDCFAEFRREELLDEDNKWYCNKCKDFVQATKQMEIFKAPPNIVISLKRFKTGKQNHRFMGMFGGGGGGSKIEDVVDFPLEGLDMSKYITGSKPEDGLIYDCYAVSNHFGSMGFGHYTAFGKNPLTNKWFDFDDSRVSD